MTLLVRRRPVLAELAKRLLTSPKNLPVTSSTVLWNGERKVGKPNALQLRNWATHATWPRTAIDIRRSQVAAAEYDIVPKDPDQPWNEKLQKYILNLFDQPNDRDRSFSSFIDPIVEDIHVLDAGCIENERNGYGVIAQIWPVDGATIKVSTVWDGNPDEDRYFWWPDGYQEMGGLKNEDLVYIMLRPATHRVVGLSSLEILRLVIDADLRGFKYNANQVSTAGGDGIFDLGENARPEQVERFKGYFLAEVAGRAATAFWGGTRNAKWIPFRNNNRDMQFLEWVIYLAKMTAAVFALHPQDLGLTNEVNKAVGEVLDQQTDDRGARTQLSRIQDYLTREIVWDKGFGGRANNLAFRFTKLNMKETIQEAQVEKIQLAGMPSRAVNEIRMKHGLQPWGKEFDLPMVITPTGAVSLLDVPTAAEALGSKGGDGTPPPEPAPPPKGGKSIEELALVAKSVDDFRMLVSQQAEQQARQQERAYEVIGGVVREAFAAIPKAPTAPAPVMSEGAIQLHLGDENPPRRTEFIYDDQGRVAGKIERVEPQGQKSAGPTRTTFIYDEDGKVVGRTVETMKEES